MFSVLLFFASLTILFFFNSHLKKQLFLLLYITTRRQNTTIVLISLLLYPGVVVHEFSHLVAAVILFVPVKDMTLVPKVIDGKIQGGSVVIQKVDVFRRTIVGIAPLFGGLAVLWLIIRYLIPLDWTVVTSQFELYDLSFMALWEPLVFISPVVQTIIGLYFLFSISSAMYSSQKDLEALLYTLPVGAVGIVLLYILGFQASWVVSLLERFEALFVNLNVVLVLVLAIQFVVYLFLSLYSTLIKPIRSG